MQLVILKKNGDGQLMNMCKYICLYKCYVKSRLKNYKNINNKNVCQKNNKKTYAVINKKMPQHLSINARDEIHKRLIETEEICAQAWTFKWGWINEQYK